MEQFDSNGRLYYDPEFHFTHGKPFTLEETIYLCKFFEIDGARSISLALGKTETAIKMKYIKLKKKGLIEHYRALWDKQMEGETI